MTAAPSSQSAGSKQRWHGDHLAAGLATPAAILARMPLPLLAKLLAIFMVVALGYAAGRARWAREGDAARVLSNTTFVLFMPALLFRTTSRIDFATLPWATLAAFFAPLLALLFVCYAWQRRAHLPPAGPSVRAISASFGNTVQLGIPIAAALFGEAGLTVHVAIVSLHALVLLTVLTTLVEMDLARASSREAGLPPNLRRMVLATVRNTVVHPVVLPVLAGLAWNLLGWPVPAPLDEVLLLLAQAAVPASLVIIGLSFARHGLQGLRATARAAISLSAAKLVLLPALVFAVGHGWAGLAGVPLAVIVMCAALPTGANALIFAQRYESLIAETTVVTVLSTLCFVATAPLWLALLHVFGA